MHRTARRADEQQCKLQEGVEVFNELVEGKETHEWQHTLFHPGGQILHQKAFNCTSGQFISDTGHL
jgi:hypothetical protein